MLVGRVLNSTIFVCSVCSYLRHADSCVAQLEAQGPSRTCDESKQDEEVGEEREEDCVCAQRVSHFFRATAYIQGGATYGRALTRHRGPTAYRSQHRRLNYPLSRPQRAYLTPGVFNVVLQKSTPSQIRQLILHYC